MNKNLHVTLVSRAMAILLSAAAFLIFIACGRGPELSPYQQIDNSRAAVSNTGHERESIKADEIDAANLPPEAREVLQLIKIGGPFPYAKDGVVFGNREGMLPQRSYGCYHEYTVKTPGNRDRGPRRIISARNGEYYYTDNHYRSFKRIRER
jgi:ribonuclease T1